MKRKLFCEYGPLAYDISIRKEALKKDIEDYIIKGYKIAKSVGLDGLIVIGGDGSFKGAMAMCKLGLPTIAMPGTIWNIYGKVMQRFCFVNCMELICNYK